MPGRRRKEEHEEHIDESWLIPYSDLLTLLLALFIVLFASSTIDSKKYNAMRESFIQALSGGTGVLDKEAPSNNSMMDVKTRDREILELEQLKRELDQYIRDKNLTMELETRLATDFLLITIRDHTLFDSGRADIKPKARETIISLSNMLLHYPGFEVVVSGHTDNRPINTREFESNWDLSSKRALNVMKLILINRGLSPSKFSAIGYGEYRPIASNETEDGRTKNRRVELAVKRQIK